MKKTVIISLFLALCSPLIAAYNIKTDPLLNTMQKEINRSMALLKKANPPVYFLSYQITDSATHTIVAALGANAFETVRRNRLLDIEARVGTRQMDNTRKIKELSFDAFSGRGFTANVPLEDDVKTLQKVLWLQTEETVKKAQEAYQKVKTNVQTAAQRTDNSPDFSAPMPPQTYYATIEPPVLDTAKIKEQLNEFSAMFKGYDFIFSSEVVFSMRAENVYYVNSEGTKLKNPAIYMRLSYSITSRNADGMEVERTNSYDFIDINKMPSPERVKADIAKSIAELKILQNAPVAEPFHGPAILRNRAAGVFFHEILGHRIEGHRQKDDDFGQTFTAKLNQQVISPLISVCDDPTTQEFNAVPLRGHYLFDNEGVPSQNVVIIEEGILKGFLMGRSPIKGFPQSTGHGRKATGYGTVARMGVTKVTASSTMSFEDLRLKLIEEIKRQDKPYGLIIEDISGGFTNTDTYGPQSFKVKPLLVYRVYPDGRPDEIIRGADIVGTPLMSFNKITAAAEDYAVFNGTCGAESGWVPVSAIAPSILVSEIEIEKVEKTYDAPPLLPPPSAPAASKTTKGAK